MTFQRVPNTIQVSMRATLFGQQVENTLYVRPVSGAPSAALVKQAAEMAGTWFRTKLLDNLGSDVVYRETFARSLDTASGAEYTDTTGAGTTGGAGVGCLSGNISLAVKFLTGLAGRSFRGRNFLFGLPTSAVSGNTVFTPFATSFVGAFTDFLDDAFAEDFVWVVVSRVADGVERAEAIATDVITAALTNLVVDSQRRRLTGSGS
jgi:hypothetical protein